MLKKLIPDIMPELLNIEAKTQHFLVNNLGILPDNKLTVDERHLWLPLLCLCSAKSMRNSNLKTLRLAEIFYLLSYATELHCSLSNKNTKIGLDKTKEKNNILIGDLLYSRIYHNLCKYGLSQYLLPLSTLLSHLHESYILHDTYGWYYGHEIKAYALLGESACFIGANSASGEKKRLLAMKEFGYHLGILDGALQTEKNIAEYYSSWLFCWHILEELNDTDREYFTIILKELGAKWKTEKPLLSIKSIV